MENATLDPATLKNVNAWLDGHYDSYTKAEIRNMMNENPKELTDAFYTKLSFGTGGLRGIMGVGSNRMNIYTVAAATQGLANYLNKQPAPSGTHSVIIGYDSRNHSREFAEVAAKVLAGNGIKALFYFEIRPVPLVSFGCRYKKCSAGIMITASHNPPEYNGYKVYWSDGGQVLPPHDTQIIQEVDKITDPSMVKQVPDLGNPLIEIIGTEIDDVYVQDTSTLQLYPNDNQEHGKELKIVYTSLHGTGITLMPRELTAWGFTSVSYVEKQIIPDGDFPTTPFPNPEEKAALQMGIDLLTETDRDLLIATDPDADRVGVAVMHKGEVQLLNGNQVASLCANHICEALTRQNKMPAKAAFIKTIVTTELFKAICDTYGKPCFNVLTGFKYIAQKIQEWETEPNGYQYIFGGEESYGYLFGTFTRDKDAITSSALICEMALHAKLRGKTLIDLLHDLFRKYGVYEENLISVNFDDSKEGKEQMTANMAKLRQSPPTKINGVDVISIEDYQTSIKSFLKANKTETLTLPKSNVLLFWLADESKVMVRPSGTEPKIKLYCGVIQKNFASVPEAIKSARKKTDDLLHSVRDLLV